VNTEIEYLIEKNKYLDLWKSSQGKEISDIQTFTRDNFAYLHYSIAQQISLCARNYWHACKRNPSAFWSYKFREKLKSYTRTI